MQNLIFKPEDVHGCTEFLSCRNSHSLDYIPFCSFKAITVCVNKLYVPAALRPSDKHLFTKGSHYCTMPGNLFSMYLISIL